MNDEHDEQKDDLLQSYVHMNLFQNIDHIMSKLKLNCKSINVVSISKYLKSTMDKQSYQDFNFLNQNNNKLSLTLEINNFTLLRFLYVRL